MTTKKRGSPLPRSVRIRPWSPLPAEEPVNQQIERAKKLPMFGPGIVITVSLPLQPAYMELYDLVPMTAREIQDLKSKGMQKPDGVLWVKRVPKEKKGKTYLTHKQGDKNER
jgi:hypothetical protein